ncbi:IS66-like element accessory protein TnpA [Flexibacterium corallicola]|uniref:IS66-like element accessory protein TnpA n=1 Tax=Flexibacterium corallicola TaxID=3037259 RepID=UPI00286F9D69|nr:transposase [Pseudovibrio sp. M1P-2-3]
MKFNTKVPWSTKDKRAICQEAMSAKESVAQVARRHGLNKGRLYNWLKDERYNPSERDHNAEPTGQPFIPVSVEELPDSTSTLCDPTPPETGSEPALVMEIRMTSGHEVRLSGSLSLPQVTTLLQELAV